MAINDLASANALRVAAIETKIRNAQAALAADQRALSAPRNQNSSAQAILRNAIAQQEEVIADLQAQLAVAQAAAAASQSAASKPPASSADITAQAQLARDDGANPKAPAPPAQQEVDANGRVVVKSFSATTNANKPATTAAGDTDRGTNAELRTVAQTQSTASLASSAAAANRRGSIQPANPRLVNVLNEETGGVYQLEVDQVNRGGTNGEGSRGDDAAPTVRPTVVNRLDELYAGARNAIISQDNVLDQFGSYTYSLSWYLLDHATYNTLLSSDTKYLNNYTLLAQSGGAPLQTTSPNFVEKTSANTTGRSPFFPLDYYLDDFEFDTKISGTPGTRGAAKLSELSFKLTEPNGISLIANLIRAVNALYFTKGLVKKGTTVNYSEAQYCMVIRFYGYDSAGNLVIPINRRGNGVTDRQAAIEKFIPFRITAIDFKVANKLVEYAIKGAPIEQLTAFSTDRGSIPQNFQFQGSTVKDILVGKSFTLTEASADTPPLTDTVFGRG